MLRFLVPFCLVVLLWTAPAPAQQVTPPPTSAAPQEMRGLWVVRDSLASPAAIRQVIDNAAAHHFNALFVQVRGRGDAYYQSALEPRAEELAGQPRRFDPLAEILRLAHARGLQVHAWMNTCLVWSKGRQPYSHAHVVNQHPDWLSRDAHGRYSLRETNDCEGAFLTPANLAARQHIHDVFLDVARRYDVDGIHFDYVRFPNSSYDYSDAALVRFKIALQNSLTPARIAAFARRGRHDRLVYPHAFPSQWQTFRRQQVTEMVASISHDIKALKPWVIISAAVFPNQSEARTLKGQDWPLWLQQGYLDAACPMAYAASTPQVAAQMAAAVATARRAGRFAYAGLGAWHIPAASTIAKIGVARALGAQGTVLFSYGGITHDGRSTTYLDTIAAHSFQAQAQVPVMPWLTPRPDAQTSAAGGSAVDIANGTGSSIQ